MIRGLLRLIGYIVALALLGFIGMGFWIVYDGTHDDFDHADAALVPGYVETKDTALGSKLAIRLDRAADLFGEGKFNAIIVSGVTPPGEDDETEAMARYLESHNVPASAIIQDHRGEKASDTVDNITAIMQDQRFHSLLLITDYHRLTRLKLVLHHGGIRELEQAHVGEWKREDASDVLQEDLLIYRNLYHWYFIPAATKVSEVTSEQEQKLKDKMNNGLDSLHK